MSINDSLERNNNFGEIVIENPKGSYKSFEIEDDPLWKDYPLGGVTYPVDYGFIEGYVSEDGHDLDVFKGSGQLNAYIKIWRCDVPIETKFALSVTPEEWEEILKIFAPVVKEQRVFASQEEFEKTLESYRK